MKSVFTTVDSSKVSEVAQVLQLTHSFSQVGQFEVRILIDSITVSFLFSLLIIQFSLPYQFYIENPSISLRHSSFFGSLFGSQLFVNHPYSLKCIIRDVQNQLFQSRFFCFSFLTYQLLLQFILSLIIKKNQKYLVILLRIIFIH